MLSDLTAGLPTPSWHWLAFAAAGLLAAKLTLNYLSAARTEARIKALGGRAPLFGGRLPFGLSFLVGFRNAVTVDETLKFWSDTFVRVCGSRASPYTVETTTVGGLRIIMTADQENIKAILATQFDDFGKGQRFRDDWVDMLGRSIFNSDGEAWHTARTRLRPVFYKERISDLECFERSVKNLLPLLDNNGETVDVKDMFLRFTLDASADFTLGVNLETLKRPLNEFAASFERLRHKKVQRERSKPFKFLVPRSSYQPDLDYIESFMDPIIAETVRQVKAEQAGTSASKKDPAFNLLRASAEVSTDQRFLRDELITSLFAGRDNTAMAFAWMFYELARHPDVVRDLRSAIIKTVGLDREPGYQELKDMKIVSNIINETLRLYPPVPINTRACIRDTTLPRGGGPDGNSPIGVLKGTGIVYSNHLLHINPEAYSDVPADHPPPEEWYPARWDTWFPKPWAFLPFHGGPRFCLGQQLVMVEMSYTLVRIFQRFSQVELRMDELGTVERREQPWLRRGAGPELAERYMKNRPRMVTEITLFPRGEVQLAFIK
ncbi:cytochrome P450 52A11 [Immersiella caudata]|uniref:Cytochrome P450 52A11 n=1 Tax=Immersiella caudata TaxID=314043 RepID=A0AA39T1P6_9PEZI|nr:cytochrome P450 52A11 [Immersiella caudata]